MSCNSKSCYNCHFLVRYSIDSGKETIHVLTWDQRDTLAEIEEKEFFRPNAFGCYHKVWYQPGHLDGNDVVDTICHKDRKNYCFYRKYVPGMMLPAASNLQEIESERREARKDRILTILGLWIAGIGLIANVLFELYKYFSE